MEKDSQLAKPENEFLENSMIRLKARALGPIIPQEDMILEPGKTSKIQKNYINLMQFLLADWVDQYKPINDLLFTWNTPIYIFACHVNLNASLEELKLAYQTVASFISCLSSEDGINYRLPLLGEYDNHNKHSAFVTQIDLANIKPRNRANERANQSVNLWSLFKDEKLLAIDGIHNYVIHIKHSPYVGYTSFCAHYFSTSDHGHEHWDCGCESHSFDGFAFLRVVK